VGRDILVLGANAPEMQLLHARLGRVGYRAIPAKTPDHAHSFLRVAGARVGAVVVPADLPALNLRAALEALRALVPGGALAFLGGGPDPGPEGRRRLRDAGVVLPIFDPVDLHTLRFQLNRALAGDRPLRGRRRTVRAPADWRAVVRAHGREKEGRIYTVSASGAFVAIQQPSLVRSLVTLRLSLSGRTAVTASGRVVMTNVPGNLQKQNLPYGMGVRFEDLSESVAVSLLVYAQERFRALAM